MGQHLLLILYKTYARLKTRSFVIYERLNNTNPLFMAATHVCASRYLFKNEIVSLPVGILSGMMDLDKL